MPFRSKLVFRGQVTDFYPHPLKGAFLPEIFLYEKSPLQGVGGIYYLSPLNLQTHAKTASYPSCLLFIISCP